MAFFFLNSTGKIYLKTDPKTSPKDSLQPPAACILTRDCMAVRMCCVITQCVAVTYIYTDDAQGRLPTHPPLNVRAYTDNAVRAHTHAHARDMTDYKLH